jgi:YHS domain-containing protein
MTTYSLRVAIAIAAALIPSLAWAQDDVRQPNAPQASSAELTQCLRVQPVIENIVTAATARAEAARLSNSPSDLRAAVDHLEAALRDVRAQLAPCTAAATPTDPHAGHTMPSAAPASKGTATSKPAPGTQSKPAASDPHAGHAASTAAPATKPAPTSKPAVPKPEASKSADPYAGHSAAQSGDKQMDPVNGLMVDPATSPKTTYQGQTYYFSSERSRKEFLENPAKFAKKPKG